MSIATDAAIRQQIWLSESPVRPCNTSRWSANFRKNTVRSTGC